MPAPGRTLPSEAIADIQRETDETVMLGAIDIDMIGGEEAVTDYLHHTMSYLLGVAIAKQGKERACEVAAAALITAETYVEELGC